MGHPLDQPDHFAAEVVSSSCHGLAAIVARRLVGDSATADRSDPARPSPFVDWKGSTAARLEYLSAALDVGSPRIFLEQIAWSKVAFASRGLPTTELRLNLTTTRDVLAQELPDRARPAALAMMDLGIAELDRAPDDSPPEIAGGSPFARLAAAFLLEVLEGDRRAAADLILRAANEGVAIKDLYTGVIAPAQAEIGRMWHRGEVSVAEEHFATTTAHLALSLLYPLLPRKAPNNRVVVCSSIEGNAHDIGIRMVADFFEMEGWRSIYLGADTPVEDLGHAIRDYNADALAISVGIATQLRPLRASIERIRMRKELGKVAIVVGGAAFGTDTLLWRTLGADAFAVTAAEAPTAVAEVLDSRGL